MAMMEMVLLVALCSAQAAAFSVSAPAGGGMRARLPFKAGLPQSQQCAVRLPRVATSVSMSADIDVKEYIKIFGRLGEKKLFGDESAGLCCHSACENCEWRYSFDIIQSARPKWIPTYREIIFKDGREHIAKWSEIFLEGDKTINRDQFCERIAAIKFEMPLGPSGFLTAKQADVSEEALDAFWGHMSRGKATLSPKQMQIRLKKMLEIADGNEGVMWPDFIDSLTSDDDSALDFDEAIVVA